MKMFEIRMIAVGDELTGAGLAKTLSDTVKEDLGARLGSLKVREIEEITPEDVEAAFALGGDVVEVTESVDVNGG